MNIAQQLDAQNARFENIQEDKRTKAVKTINKRINKAGGCTEERLANYTKKIDWCINHNQQKAPATASVLTPDMVQEMVVWDKKVMASNQRELFQPAYGTIHGALLSFVKSGKVDPIDPKVYYDHFLPIATPAPVAAPAPVEAPAPVAAPVTVAAPVAVEKVKCPLCAGGTRKRKNFQKTGFCEKCFKKQGFSLLFCKLTDACMNTVLTDVQRIEYEAMERIHAAMSGGITRESKVFARGVLGLLEVLATETEVQEEEPEEPEEEEEENSSNSGQKRSREDYEEEEIIDTFYPQSPESNSQENGLATDILRAIAQCPRLGAPEMRNMAITFQDPSKHERLREYTATLLNGVPKRYKIRIENSDTGSTGSFEKVFSDYGDALQFKEQLEEDAPYFQYAVEQLNV